MDQAHIANGKAGIVRLKRMDTSHQHVAYGRVAVRRHRNSLAFPNQSQDSAHHDMGLAGAGWPLNRQDRPVHRPHGPDHAVKRLVTFLQRQWRRTVEPGRVLREKIFGSPVGSGPALIHDHFPDGSGDRTRMQGETGKEIQLVGETGAPTRSHLQRDPSAASVQIGDFYRRESVLPRKNGINPLSQFCLLGWIEIVTPHRPLHRIHISIRDKSGKAVHVVDQILEIFRGRVEHGPGLGFAFAPMKHSQIVEHLLAILGQAGG